MESKISISVPTPCEENWQKMQPLEKGRFCGACKKQILDFSTLSDREILRKYNSEKNLCGRFSSKQLERNITIPKEKSSFWMASFSGILTVFTLTNNNVYSQRIVDTTQTDETSNFLTASTNLDLNISGTVQGSDRLMIYGVAVENKRTSEKIVSVDGNFNLTAQIGDEIEFSKLGYNHQVIIVNSEQNWDIILRDDTSEIDEIYTMGIVVVEEKRSFFGRIFHSIGKIFK